MAMENQHDIIKITNWKKWRKQTRKTGTEGAQTWALLCFPRPTYSVYTLVGRPILSLNTRAGGSGYTWKLVSVVKSFWKNDPRLFLRNSLFCHRTLILYSLEISCYFFLYKMCPCFVSFFHCAILERRGGGGDLEIRSTKVQQCTATHLTGWSNWLFEAAKLEKQHGTCVSEASLALREKKNGSIICLIR